MEPQTPSLISSDRVFAAWSGMRQAIALRKLSDDSVASYRSIWDGWIAFVLARGLSWDLAKSTDVRDFLQAVPARASARGKVLPSNVTQKRYFRVLREIYFCARASGWIDSVPVDHAAAVSRSEAHESLVFHRLHWSRLFAALPQFREPLPDQVAWTEVRNVAMLLLLMQTALSVSELADLNVGDLQTPRLQVSHSGKVTLDLPYPPWESAPAPTVIRIRGPRPDQLRELELGTPAVETVHAWLGLRLAMAMPDGLDSPLFMSRKGAGRLTAKTVFFVTNAHIQQTLGQEFGDVALAHAGPMTLRNSCIVRWLENPQLSEAEVLRSAGLKDAKSLARLRQHVIAPQSSSAAFHEAPGEAS